MSRQYDFSNRVALITGANGGIGRASALAFAECGASVVVSSRGIDEGEQTVDLIRQARGTACFVRCDVSDAFQVESLISATIDRFGGIDFAFNNAGIEGTSFVPAADYTEESWDQVLDINLKGMWLCMKFQIPHLLKRRGAAIVNMASVGGLMGGNLGCAYHASKHGVVGLTKAAAIEYAPQGLRINAVAPATIRTAMAERMFLHDETIAKQVTAYQPMQRLGEPKEVADAVIWLCSEHASFTTGHTFPVDGGVMAQ